MAEILTESFCERCGTRYTFESNAAKGRKLGRFKTLSRGLKTFVLSDDTSLDEALASARSDVEREATATQLEAFHQTFNFCMSCRQYTCANCWNEVEGRCLTCAPHLGHEVLPAPFPNLDPTAQLPGLAPNGNGSTPLDALAWPTIDLVRSDEPYVAEQPAVGEVAPDGPVVAEPEPAEPGAVEAPAEPEPEPEVVAALELEPEVVEPEPVAAAEIEIAADEEPGTDGLLDALARLDADAAEPEPEPDPEPAAEVLAAEPEPVVAEPPKTPDERAATAARRTSELLARFRPGESIDAALEEFEAARATEQDVAEVSVAPEPETEPVVAVAPEPEPEPEPDPVAAGEPEPEPEPVAAVRPEPEPEPVGAAEASPEPHTDDRVEVPAWQIVAPDTTPRTADGVAPQPPAAPPSAQPPQRQPAAPETPPAPQWPTTPQWPNASAAAPDPLAFLTSRSKPDAAAEDVWAASSREMLAAPAPQAAVQSCVSCGLSLSANARFCRRCGTRQQG